MFKWFAVKSMLITIYSIFKFQSGTGTPRQIPGVES